jgi:putative N6-adenine-specific DNA methylase
VSPRIDTFTVCQPGIEEITHAELVRLGAKCRVTHGGIIASLTWSQLALASMQLRTATRILVRVARFDATNFSELAVGLRRIDWGSWLAEDAEVDIRVSSTASKLYHTDAIEERVREVVGQGFGAPQRLSVRLDHNLVTVSLDSSGDPLFMRGWRTEAVEAPIRESLAAALVLWSGWDAKAPLVDPCCGSGTIAIEAAMWARRIAPGRNRSFAFEQWPCAKGIDWERLWAAIDADVRPSGPTIRASDIDPEAVEIARRNAERAGVEIDLRVVAAAERANEPRGPKAGWVITNPPYGTRVGGNLKELYSAVGRLAEPPWRLAVVGAQGSPTNAFGRQWEDSLSTRNGGLAVRFLRSGTV